MRAIIRKELADYFNSVRFLVLFMLVLISSGLTLFMVQQGIRQTLEASGAVSVSGFVFLTLFQPSLTIGNYAIISPFSLLVPIIGIALVFDAINSERTNRTMSRLLSQPVYRDSVINGKFIAGIFTMAVVLGTTMLLVAGYGLRMIGVPPGAEEIIRLFLYFVVTLAYGAFWMGLSLLFSVVFRRSAGSLLVPIVIFLVFYLFWVVLGLGPTIANAISPADTSSPLAAQINNAQLTQTLLRISPAYLYQEAYLVLLLPIWKGMGVITSAQAAFMVQNPLSLGQSLLAIWPHLVSIVGLSVVCFAASYVVFMRQEIRAT